MYLHLSVEPSLQALSSNKSKARTPVQEVITIESDSDQESERDEGPEEGEVGAGPVTLLSHCGFTIIPIFHLWFAQRGQAQAGSEWSEAELRDGIYCAEKAKLVYGRRAYWKEVCVEWSEELCSVWGWFAVTSC